MQIKKNIYFLAQGLSRFLLKGSECPFTQFQGVRTVSGSKALARVLLAETVCLVSCLREVNIHFKRCPLSVCSFHPEPEAGGRGVDGRVRRVRIPAPA